LTRWDKTLSEFVKLDLTLGLEAWLNRLEYMGELQIAEWFIKKYIYDFTQASAIRKEKA